MNVSSVHEGNGKTFTKDLYKKYSRLMYATALSMIPDCQDCEDIVQDAVESLCKKVHMLMGLPAPALSVYIVYTVKNRARNFKRHQTVKDKHVVAMANTSLEKIESPDPLPETRMELEEQVDALYRVWPELPERTGNFFTGSMCCGRKTRNCRGFCIASRIASGCG